MPSQTASENRASSGTATAVDGPVGIGGWLGLLAIGVALSPLRLGGSAAELREILALMPENHPSRGLLFAEMVCVGVLAFAFLIGAVLFFQKRRIAPPVLMLLLAAMILVAIIDTYAVIAYFPGAQAIDGWTIASLIVPLIWIAYLRTSERVRNTFVN